MGLEAIIQLREIFQRTVRLTDRVRPEQPEKSGFFSRQGHDFGNNSSAHRNSLFTLSYRGSSLK
jgi:hypothetical protein